MYCTSQYYGNETLEVVWHTFVLNYLISVLVHSLHNILKHVVGILEGCRAVRTWTTRGGLVRILTMINSPESFLQAIEIQFSFLLRIEPLPKLLDACIPCILALRALHLDI
jgi:hypothetical protein